ncbi:MAG: NUDIX domain-containing protein [Candidatus Paceibacterota bacterium]
MKEGASDTEYSYGIVPLYKNKNGEIEVLFIQHKEGKWGFPKGHSEKDEEPLIAAKREFSEETGITDFELLEGLIFSESYTHHKEGYPRLKVVEYAPAIVYSKELSPQVDEVNDTKWVDLAHAKDVQLTETRSKLLNSVLEYLSAKQL